MARNQTQSSQSKRREEEEDERDDEEEDEDERDEEDEDEDEEGRKPSDSDDEGDDEEGDDLDSALNDRGGKPSIFIEPWRKKGSVAIWLHPKTKFARVGRHKWFRIVQFTKRNGEEVSFIRFENFNSHESPDFVSISKDRNEDDLKRTHRARICPMSKMIEWVDDAVLDGRLAPETVVFRFEDGDPEHTVELHAAGLTGLIGLERFPERLKKQCKKAKVLQKEPWNENLNLKLSHAFQVVDDADPSEVKWALEPQDLFFAMKDAIKKEKKRNGDDDGDPQKNPYAMLWEFDKDKAAKNFGKGNEVIPQPKRKLTSKIRRLLEGPKRADQMDVIGPGNLLELRASMENAAVIDLPFDEFFKEAEKAGLMKGQADKPQSVKTSAKSKDDDEDAPQSEPKPKTSSEPTSAQTKGKPAQEPEVEGTCDICGEPIDDDDIECKACGTTFDEENEYHVDGIRCTECGTTVPLKDASEEDGDLKQICPKCGTIHRLSPSVDRYYGELRDKVFKGEVKFAWTAEPKSEPKKVEPKRAGRSGRSKASSDSKQLDKATKGERFPF